MTTYKLTNSDKILKINGNFITEITPNPTLGEYQNYQDWLTLGNTPEPADPEPTQTINQVDIKRFKLALFHEGLYDDVNTAIANLSDPQGSLAKISWDNARDVYRDDPMLAQIAAILNKSEAEIDAIFTLALTLI